MTEKEMRELISKSDLVFKFLEMYCDLHSNRIICSQVKKETVKTDNESHFMITSNSTFKDCNLKDFQAVLRCKFNNLNDYKDNPLYDYDTWACIMLNTIKEFTSRESDTLSVSYCDLHLILFQDEQSKIDYIRQERF